MTNMHLLNTGILFYWLLSSDTRECLVYSRCLITIVDRELGVLAVRVEGEKDVVNDFQISKYISQWGQNKDLVLDLLNVRCQWYM